MKDVFFIILNLNNNDVIKPLYESLIKHDDYPKSLVFIDNGSHQDNSRAYLRSICENNIYNHYIQLPHNVGTTRAWNIGIKYIRENCKDAGYIGFINSDMFVEANWLKPMMDIFELNINNPGMVSNQLRDQAFFPSIQHDGPDFKKPFEFRMGIEGSQIIPYRKSLQVEYGHLGCAVFKKEVFDTVGLFDENMFVYGSDFDIQIRLKMAGYSIWHCPESIARHRTFHTCREVKRDPVIKKICDEDGDYFFSKWGLETLDRFENYLNYWDCNEGFLRSEYNGDPKRIEVTI